MKKIIFIIAAVLALYSCSDDNFKIEGTITNAQTSMIYLEKLGIDRTTPIDSSEINKKGQFKLSGSVSYPTFFLLKLNDQKFVTLLIDSLEEITFSADYVNFSNDYLVKGSFGSKKVKQLNDKLSKTNTSIDSIRSLMSLSTANKDYQKQEKEWGREIASIYEDQQEFSKIFIEENPFSMASVLAIYQKFNNGNYVMQDLQTLKMAASALHSMYPKSVHAQSLYRDTEKLIRDIKAQEMNEFVDKYGTNSPEITLPNPNGKEIALSSLRGKTVLVHFWSAADRTSRIINQVLKDNYQKFKSKGFDIYQISVDENREAWENAIKQDGLTWINVGDMNGSLSAVNSYNITSIPSNFLLDEEGNIIGRDLKGPALHRKLNEILN
ncbi:MAG: TlpA disulfide reductase family protein [Prolixibacteraceae bacterium]|nr:TlpA disulfide reductase family protein [Prolixibacteraceae bacterium]